MTGPRTWPLHLRYAWEHSDDRRLVAARHRLDTRVLPPVSVVSEGGPGGPSIGYAGVPHGLVKILQLLEHLREAGGAPAGERRSVPVRRRHLFGAGAIPPADLVAVGCAPDQARHLPGRAALLLPYRLHLVVDLPEERGAWRRAVSRRERQWFNARAKAADWRLEVARDEPSFHLFYDTMHVPTMRARHGGRARSEARDSALECLFRNGLLVFVTAGGVRVAGALCHRGRDGATVTVRLLGVRDGAPEHYRDGAFKALYHLLLDWADHHGVRHVDFGGTEAWLSKGIFQWKRRFGPRVVPAPNHLGRLRVWWHARRDTPAVRDFLVANPVLEPADGGFRAVYFHDDRRAPRFDLAHTCANVDRYRTVHLDDHLAGGALR